MKVTTFAHCGAIDPGPCTMLSGIDVLVPWHGNWRHLSYWVMMEPAWACVLVGLFVLYGWRKGYLR